MVLYVYNSTFKHQVYGYNECIVYLINTYMKCK